MADFCLQCSQRYLDIDKSDFNFGYESGAIVAVLCEGCGWCIVNSDGACIDEECSENHGEKKA